MNTQGIIAVLFVGLAAFVPVWTLAAVRRRYGREVLLQRLGWWLWIRMFCNGIMGAGVVMTGFGVWATTQGIKDPTWGGVLLWILIIAILCVGGASLFSRKTPTETLYRESYLLMVLWFEAVVVAVLVRFLANVQLSVHIFNGLLLACFGAMFTRLLKRWI